MAINSAVMRNIAGTELDKLIPWLDPEVRSDLVTSIIRQWVTCDGHAGVFTEYVNYWFHLAQVGDQIHVGHEVVTESKLRDILLAARAVEDEIAELVRELSLRQRVTFENKDGVRMELRASPHERRFEARLAEDDEE
jgi:hypothetical protein